MFLSLRRGAPWLLIALCGLPLFSAAQTGSVEGVVSDLGTSETLIGANVKLGELPPMATDLDGHFAFKAPYGTYLLTVESIGYQTQQRNVTVGAEPLKLAIKMEAGTPQELRAVKVTADVARSRETPVAFSTISPVRIQEELAGRDLPLLLNTTPGVYATSNGGGDGDARITIRGFDQRNLAVMLDGVPVNDMENGQVYWSNWFGLDLVTRSVQVQRGLGASKLALPSVGGTVNILSKGIDQKRSFTVKQEFADNAYLRTTLGFTSGKMKGDWGLTLAGSYKQGDGWVDLTYTKGWFYFAKIEKRLGKHLLSLSGFGAPQEHGQRPYQQHIGTYSADFANDLGIQGPHNDWGRRYNGHWGHLTRYDYNPDGSKYNETSEDLNCWINYYHKPQFSLRDVWEVNDRLFISNTAYLSIGHGGGTRLFGGNSSTLASDDEELIDLQGVYDRNNNWAFVNGEIPFPNNSRKSSMIIRSSVNNHFWYGLLSTASYKLKDDLDLSGGIDLRSYKGEHYAEPYDMLGGKYFMDSDGNDQNRASDTVRTGDKMSYHNDGLVQWGGLFLQLEHHTPAFSWFVSGTAATTSYQRFDYFRRRDLVIDGDTYNEAVGYGDVFYLGSHGHITAYEGSAVTTSGDTTLINNPSGYADGYIVGAHSTYTSASSESRTAQTAKKWIPGFTVKGGANYNLNEWHNVFFNLGFLSNAPRFANVYDNNNTLFNNIKNEQVRAVELGWSYKRESVNVNLNGYYTYWKNKPLNGGLRVTIDDEPRTLNINGMDARHMGMELDGAWNFQPKWTLEGLVSLGDWTWQSVVKDEPLRDEDGNPAVDELGNPQTISFDARGVHVGNAAQTQLGALLRYEPIKGLYVKVRETYFGRQWADFDPFSLSGSDSGRESWLTPDYFLTEVHAGYRWHIKKVDFAITASLLNAFDTFYISDATNNDTNLSPAYTDFDAKSSSVYFGEGRRWTIGVQITL